MRRIAVLAAVLLAFAAGWLGRGCAGADEATVATPPALAPTTRPAETPPAPGRREYATPHDGRSPDTRRSDAPNTAGPAVPPPAAPEESRKPPAAADGARPFDEVTGDVVDSRTGEGVDGVRLHLCYSDDGENWGWFGDTTQRGGRFRFDLRSVSFDAKTRFELRGGRDGYRIARAPVTTSPVRLEIERLDRAQRPGRVVGTARADDGEPLAGRLMISLHDELDIHSCGVWVAADPNGRFAIDGVAPGNWRIALSESDATVDVNVAEDGESPVELVAKFDGAPTGAFAPGRLDTATYERVKSVLDGAVSAALAAADAAGGPKGNAFDNEAVRSALWQGQQFEYQWMRHAPGRDVAVTGLPAADGAYVRLEHADGAGCEWRAAARGGRAQFASVPYGKWRATLVRPGMPDVSAELDLDAGDGAESVPLPAAK